MGAGVEAESERGPEWSVELPLSPPFRPFYSFLLPSLTFFI